jgi:hypothetical protein
VLGGLLAVLLRLALTLAAERALPVPFPGAAGGLLLAGSALREARAGAGVARRGIEHQPVDRAGRPARAVRRGDAPPPADGLPPRTATLLTSAQNAPRSDRRHAHSRSG